MGRRAKLNPQSVIRRKSSSWNGGLPKWALISVPPAIKAAAASGVPAGTEARGPRAVFFAEENRQQRRDDDRERAAQGITENQAIERKAQLRQRFIAGARGGGRPRGPDVEGGRPAAAGRRRRARSRPRTRY